MKKTTVTAAVMVMLLLAQRTQAGVSLIMNGSFESDGIINDIAVKAPQRWCDVNIPSDKFGGWVNTLWKTHGNYSLSLYSGFVTFTAGDMITVSQQVYLTDVNQIIFDLRLGTIAGYLWDPGKRSALLLIDGNVVWDSSDWMPDASGEYRNQMVDVNEIYKDAGPHTLSLAMRANVSEIEWFFQYLAQWDFVKFDTHCGGFGYLPEDLNHDCYVDMLDLKVLAGQWLKVDAKGEYDLYPDGIVNFGGFARLANKWMSYRDWRDWDDPNFLNLELLDGDLDDDGIVNLRDFAILTGDWTSEGPCIRSDIDGSGIVDYRDLSKLADEWLLKSWLYGLE